METFFILNTNNHSCVPSGTPALYRHGDLITDGDTKAYFFPRETTIPVVRYCDMDDAPGTATFIPAVGGDLKISCVPNTDDPYTPNDCLIEDVESFPADAHSYMVSRGLSGLALSDNSKLIMLTTEYGNNHVCATPAGSWSYADGCVEYEGIGVSWPPAPRVVRPTCPESHNEASNLTAFTLVSSLVVGCVLSIAIILCIAAGKKEVVAPPPYTDSHIRDDDGNEFVRQKVEAGGDCSDDGVPEPVHSVLINNRWSPTSQPSPVPLDGGVAGDDGG